MAFFMKAFHFVVYSLVIYSCFENKIAQIGAKDPALRENVNNADGQERNIVILSEEVSDVSSYHKQFKTKPETEDGAGEASESYTIDDEDGERDRKADSGSGDGMDVQGDEPAASSDGSDPKLDGPSLAMDPILNSTATRSPDKTLTVNSTAIVTPALSLSSTTFNVIVSTSTLHDESANRPGSSTPPLITAHASSDVQNSMIKIDASVFTSMKKTSLSTSAMSTKETKAATVVVSSSSSVSIMGPTSKQPTTIETTTKESNDVQNQKGPSQKVKEKKTLFGFVTIEILVALLAGAACAIILLVFLVYRLKKRNEGSYELQETLMLKSGGYGEEKEVFV